LSKPLDRRIIGILGCCARSPPACMRFSVGQASCYLWAYDSLGRSHRVCGLGACRLAIRWARSTGVWGDLERSGETAIPCSP